MGDFKINEKSVFTQSGSAEPVLASTVTGAGRLVSIQEFDSTSDTTWTRPSGVTIILVYCTGSGGVSGAGGQTHDNGGAGGSGGTAIKVYDVSGTASVTIVVGATGSAPTGVNSNDGGTSGSSTFAGPGGTITGTGGSNGLHGNSGTAAGGNGGTASGGDINIKGNPGGGGGDDIARWHMPPKGGASYWGGQGNVRGDDAGTYKGSTAESTSSKGAGGSGNHPAYSSGSGYDANTGIHNFASDGYIVVFEYN